LSCLPAEIFSGMVLVSRVLDMSISLFRGILFTLALLLFGACDKLQPTEAVPHQPIVGEHSSLECASCHGKSLSEVPTCTQCHEQDRQYADHYPGLECGKCHQITAWEGLEHDHQCKLPHEGYGECTDCHLGTTSSFSCTHCHAHGESEMKKEHRGETNNFVWESKACLECHSQCKE
jgi:hypothetical protein